MEKAMQAIKGDNRITNAYIIAFILILCSYLASIYTNRQLIKQSKKVDHTNEFILDLERLNATVRNAENGTRGYVLSKKIEFLAPYYGTRKAADSLTARLSELVKDNPSQLRRLDQLYSLIIKRLDIVDFAIKDFENKGLVLTDSMRSLQPDVLQIMKDIRNISTTMQVEELKLLKDRANRLQKSFNLIDIINFISLIIASFLIIFGFFTYRKENKARRTAVQRIQDFQEELKHRVDDLDNANKELVHMKSLEKFTATGRIARTIAHEVRNPLTNINLAADQLKTELGDKQAETALFFEMIERNSNRINQLISNLLNATKFSELNYEISSLHTLLDNAIAEAEDRIAMRNVSVIKKYKNDHDKVMADAEKLKIAFLNIIINAVEALGSIGEPRELTIETKEESGKCRIFFEDNGPGIDNESLQKIFEPYYTNKPDGTGLGLTNSQNIILNHKGDISITSTEGEGTTVIVTLDLV